MKAEHWQAALQVIEEVDEPSRSWRLNWSHGWCLFKLAQCDRALNSLRRAVLQNARSPTCQFGLGAVLLEQGKLDEAARHLETSLGLKDSTITRLCLALTYVQQERLSDAERIHLEGIERRPRNHHRVEAYADFLSDCGRDAEAEAQYQKARRMKEP